MLGVLIFKLKTIEKKKHTKKLRDKPRLAKYANIELFSINTSTNAISSTMSVTGTISETDPQAAALAIALG